MINNEEQQFLNDLEKKHWTAADKLGFTLDADQYKHTVIGLVFIKYVSDAFDTRSEELHAQLQDENHEYYLDPVGFGGVDSDEYKEEIAAELEVRDYYLETNTFWVPTQARWVFLQNRNKVVLMGEIWINPEGEVLTEAPKGEGEKRKCKKISQVGTLIDNALDAIEVENPKFKGVLNKLYASLQIDQAKQTGLDPERAAMAAMAAMAAISGKMLETLDTLYQTSSEQYKPLKTTAALFPDALVDSELGVIPEGWEVNAIEEIVDLGSAKRIFSKEYVEEGIPFYRGKEVAALSGGNNIQPDMFITKERYEELKEKSGTLKEHDMLITSVGTIGNTYLVQKEDEFYFKDRCLTWIKSYKKDVISCFFKNWFDSLIGKTAIENIEISSTQQAITIASINNISLIMPSTDVHKYFNQLIESNFNKRVEDLRQVQIFFDLRDYLLPKLFPGELTPA